MKAILTDRESYLSTYQWARETLNIKRMNMHTGIFDTEEGEEYIIVTSPEPLISIELESYMISPVCKVGILLEMAKTRMRK